MGVVRRHSIMAHAFLFLGLLALTMAPVAMAQSQQGTGQIVGTVYDQTGASVPKAKVTATGKATGLLRETETNDDGQYRIVLLPPGPYTVTVNATGFKLYKTEITVNVGSAITLDPKLQVGAVSEVVEVTATQIIETTAVQTDALINQRSITELPINGRRFQDFVTLTPTVQIEPQRSGISFAGQRGINSNVTIDGADYNQPFFGGIRGGERSNQAFTIPQESIAEFQIVPYGYSAEFGRSTAGVLNAVTKSGTNEWHGSGFYFLRHKELARKDAFNRQALDSQHQAGGSFGGAVRKDKSFFFVSAELQQVNNPREVVFSRLNPTSGNLPGGRTSANGEAYDYYKSLEAPFTQTNDAWTVLGRWDEQLTSNHRVNVRYHYSTNTAENAVATGVQIFPQTNNALDNNGTEGNNQHTVAGQWTGILSPRVVNELRLQYSKERRPRLSNSALGGVSNTVGNIGARSFLPTTQSDYRVQISENMTWNVGRHSVKFGGEFNHLFADQFFQFNQFGIFSISGSTVDTVLQIMALDPTNVNDRRFDSTAVSYRVNIGNGLAEMTMRELAFFAQDAWRITPRFTLTAGFRWEGYFNPSPDVSNSALYNAVASANFPLGTVDPAAIPDNLNQFMPRVGIAWDPRGNGRTVIRANAGIYYARSPLLLFAGPINNFRTPAGDLSVQLPLALPTGYVCTPIATGDTCNTVYWQLRRAGIDLNALNFATLPQVTSAQIQQIATGLGLPFDPNQGLAPITWANNYESPRAWQWNLAMEHELARGWSIGGDYVYLNTVHLERNRDLNVPTPFVPTNDLSGRFCFGLRRGVAGVCPVQVAGVDQPQQRPLATLNSIQQRESSARSLYRAFTLRSTFRRAKWQFQGYYTLGFNYSDDDNERSAGGLTYDNGFNLIPEYGYADLDARHLFVFNGVYEAPWGFTLSGLGRFRSGRAVDVTTGADTNGDFGGPDRPMQAAGVPFKRNSFRDRADYSMDMRVAKRFNLPREGMFINLTADFFNLFNFDNVKIGSSNRIYGVGINTSGAVVAPGSNFMILRDPADCFNASTGLGNKSCYDNNNTPGSPFQVQFGVRFQF